VWKVEQKLVENFSFALLLFCKGIESKKKYQVKKKKRATIFARHWCYSG
jgi:Kef-type K+ transport system membrane component KefB